MDWKSLFRRTPDVVALSLHPDRGVRALPCRSGWRSRPTGGSRTRTGHRRNLCRPGRPAALPRRTDRAGAAQPAAQRDAAALPRSGRCRTGRCHALADRRLHRLPGRRGADRRCCPAGTGPGPGPAGDGDLGAGLRRARTHGPLLAAGLAPKTIDIEDLGQRNLGQRAAGTAAAFATLGFTEREAPLTIVAGGELCLTRAIGWAMPRRGSARRRRAPGAAGAAHPWTPFDRQVTQFAVKQLQLLPAAAGQPAAAAGRKPDPARARRRPSTLLRSDLPDTPAWREAAHHRYAWLLGVASARLPTTTAEAPAAAPSAGAASPAGPQPRPCRSLHPLRSERPCIGALHTRAHSHTGRGFGGRVGSRNGVGIGRRHVVGLCPAGRCPGARAGPCPARPSTRRSAH